MEKVTITIGKKNWKVLKKLELKEDFKTHDEAIEFLLNNYKIPPIKKSLKKEVEND